MSGTRGAGTRAAAEAPGEAVLCAPIPLPAAVGARQAPVTCLCPAPFLCSFASESQGGKDILHVPV